MPAAVVSVWRRIVVAAQGFTLAQRTIAIIGTAAVVLGIVALTAWATKPAMVPLFTGLAPADASAVVEQLRSAGVPYELAGGGSSVLVPEAQVYEQRMALAADGLPGETSTGYALLDQMGVTASDFQQNVTWQRALEGELAATISAMRPIETATVRLALPAETVFTAQRVPPTASVFVATSRTAGLTPEQVSAIVHLVSASVEGMAASDVAVVDADGTVLSTVGTGPVGASSGSRGDQIAQLQDQVLAMIERVVGPGNASVVVSADIVSATVERTTETYEPADGAQPLTERTTSEEYTGGAGGAAGVLGPDNIAVPGDRADGGTYLAQTVDRTNPNNRVVEVTSIPAGDIGRKSVSIAVDREAAAGTSAAAVEALAVAAAGLDIAAGDAVTVQIVDFDRSLVEQAEAAIGAAREAAAQEAFWSNIRLGAIGIGVLILVIVIVALIRSAVSRQVREPIDVGMLHERRDTLAAPTGIEALDALSTERDELELPVAPTDADERRRALNALAQRDPSRTAELLRQIMDERSLP